MSAELRKLLNVIAAKRFERAEAQWRTVLAELRLPLFYQPALRIALKKSNWRTADDPAKYLRSVACRQAERLGLADVDGPPPVSAILLPDDNYEDVVDGEDERFDDDGYFSRVDPALIDPDERCGTVVNWDRVATRVGLDQSEIFILECRSDGLTRERILSEMAEDEQNRLELQAAYRRVHDRMPQIREALAEDIFRQEPPRDRKKQVRKE